MNNKDLKSSPVKKAKSLPIVLNPKTQAVKKAKSVPTIVPQKSKSSSTKSSSTKSSTKSSSTPDIGENGRYFGLPTSTPSFTELIEYNLKFLNGKLQETFYHGAPVDPETLPLLDKLKSINSNRFFTIEGQPSLCEGPTFISKTWEVNGKTWGNWWYKSEQKGYLTGFIEDSTRSKNLITYLSKHEKVYINIARKDGGYFTNFPDVLLYNVTRESTRESEDKKWSKWRLRTNIPKEHYFEESDIKILKDCLFITIVVKKYCKDSIEDILLDYYNSLN